MPKSIKKFWNFRTLDDTTTELLIYDDIAMKTSVDWWTGQAGTEVTPKDFREDLKAVESDNICVRINSGGGDVFAAESIATAIKDERQNGKKITCKIDGICASAAVQIAMACESIAIPSSAYMMIHDPLTLLIGYYQVADLEKVSNTLNKIKSGIVNAYVDKTGIDRAEIESLMTEETWLTGDEAVEKGFADEVLFDEVKTEPIIDSNTELFVNGARLSFAAYTKIPEKLKTAFNATSISKNKDEKKGDFEMDFKNAAELQAAFPEFVNELTENAKKEGAKAERERIQAIDELSGKVDGEMLNKAKYETFENAEKVAFSAMKEGKFVNSTVINGYVDDAQNVNKVAGEANNGTQVDDKDAEKKEAFDTIDKIAKEIF